MAISPLDDDAEFEAENTKSVNGLKEVKYTFSSKSSSLLVHLHLQLLQGKINAASNQWQLNLPFEEGLSSLY